MHFFGLAALGVTALAPIVTSLPTATNHVIHEKRNTFSSWLPNKDLHINPNLKLPMRVGLTQQNLDRGNDILMQVSSPTSELYGKHWSPKEIAEFFEPTTESIDAVRKWLQDSGVDGSRLSLSRGKNWFQFDASVAEVERLLQTKYKVYTHKSGQNHIACDEYSVPQELSRHIDLIMPTVHFDTKIVEDPNQKQKRAIPTDLQPGNPGSGFLPKKGRTIKGPGISPQAAQPFDLSTCNSQITPECLRALYAFPEGSLAQSSYGIVEYTPQAYLQGDLDLFYSNLATNIPAGTGPVVDSIDGGVVQTDQQGFNFNGESDLDLEYAIALVYPQEVTLYQVGDLVQGASFNNFLDALDASYCTTAGGDDPNFDGIYPDPNPGGYQSQDCGTYTATAVISTSYGSNEADVSPAYANRQCNEYMKLGMSGTTILYSSGDYGVAGNGGACCVNPSCAGGDLNDGGSGTFNPSFPGGCPYVTSVGATQIVPGASVTEPEEACETVIFSGGGFSNVFPLPDYQADAVGGFFAANDPGYSAEQFNNSGMVRGFPDLSANGANYVVAVDGALSLIYGTSASSPTVGAIITLINEERASAGKGPVGFLNPTLYANPDVLNDITAGGNQGCGTPGFTAVAGWDPVTGLGTPAYDRMLPLFMGLP